MKKLNTIIAALLVSASFNSFAGDCTPMSGEYLIGKSDEANFSTINEAFNALECGGEEAPVSFLIESGTYNERVTLANIEGASAINTITFASKSGVNTDVVLSYNTSNATLVLVDAKYISFENMTIDHKDGTYGNSLRVDGEASNLTFKNMIFNGVIMPRTGAINAAVYFTSTAAKSEIAFDGCDFNNGSIGICKAGVNGSAADTKTSITGNTFSNQNETGIALANEAAPVVTANVVHTSSPDKNYVAISLDNISSNMVVNKNVVSAINSATGILLNDCVAQASRPGQAVSNSITVNGNHDAYGIRVTGNTNQQVIDFNTIKLMVNRADASTQAFYMNTGSGKDVSMMNSTYFDLSAGSYMVYGDSYKSYSGDKKSTSLSASAEGINMESGSVIK